MGSEEKRQVDLSQFNFVRLANNYLHKAKGGEFPLQEVDLLNGYVDYVMQEQQERLKSYNVGVVLVCINNPYWQYAKPVIDGIKQFFLPGHKTEVMLWGDMGQFQEAKDVTFGADKVFQTESVHWPYPTLMRYHLFLEQEEYLKKFDYLFYIDLDMRIVGIVGDEILGDGLTAAEHPMYSLRSNLYPPYEPNKESHCFIPRPGKVISEDGKPRFKPYYYAGGVQGGKTADFIEAMKGCRDLIDKDMEKGYIPIWNDETAWNKYLSEHEPAVVLNPAYVYPDSMIQEYYVKVWGRNYVPKIITLTKPFTVSKEGGDAAKAMTATM